MGNCPVRNGNASEGGAAAQCRMPLHGDLYSTFTASRGLLLMHSEYVEIAGELHVQFLVLLRGLYPHIHFPVSESR
ncbi:MAG: hypothetical protein IPH77_06270 [Ignavibacteria bacterium]|nr:hypothetical protein [Ignavibacteria bacterium]